MTVHGRFTPLACPAFPFSSKTTKTSAETYFGYKNKEGMKTRAHTTLKAKYQVIIISYCFI